MSFTRQQLIFLGVVGAIVLIFLIIFFAGGRRSSTERVELTVWGIDDKVAWRDTIFQYRRLHSNVRIEYTQIDPENYEKELVNALAADRGPDIFMFNSRWLYKHGDKIAAFPSETMSLSAFSELFPKVAEQDFLYNGQIYALPLSVDTLALVYNRDIFDGRGVALSPKTWEEFQSLVPRLRTINKQGSLTLAAASIGGPSENIPNAADILSLLMFQAGATQTDEELGTTRINPNTKEGENALSFYAQFASPTSTYYAWSNSFESSTESFAEGKTAMVFVYAYQLPRIKEKNPFLDYAIAPAPQINPDNPINIANYWGLAVSTKSLSQNVAWDFVTFAATDKDNAANYLKTTSRPPALRSLINDHLSDKDLGVFASQALTARTWFQVDDIAFQRILNGAIKRALGGAPLYQVLRQVDAEIIQLERELTR
ncbi:MAG: extracellular solute-binding protein [Candidatus Colwellbacteria bacterium]|nr:extracellular solute-binding protein [Candidatus Colwellbacteria bacterium]